MTNRQSKFMVFGIGAVQLLSALVCVIHEAPIFEGSMVIIGVGTVVGAVSGLLAESLTRN